MSVAQLPDSTVKLITSSQVITSVSTAVKELVENSLDAGATSVDVKLVNNGLDRIEVKDNGSGISKSNTPFMAMPHYTSKISSFSDLESLETYGFRGEALNALCRVGQVTLTTATSTDPMAMVYTLDSSGNIVGTKPSHHAQGTTVLVTNLFKNLPVRRQLMGSSRRAQEELKQVETVVKSLAVIKPNVRVSLCHNKCLLWQKTPCSNLQNSFSQLIGYSTCQKLEHLCLKVSNETSIDMFVPKKDCDISILTKSTPALSLVFINQRPVTHKKLLKILHKQLAESFGDNFSTRKFAVCLVSIYSSPSNLDVNLEPNKTKILLQDEDDILNEIQKQLFTYYSLPNVEKGNVLEVENSSKLQRLHLESPIQDTEEVGPRKKRKLDDEHCAVESGGIFKNGVISHSTEMSHSLDRNTEAHLIGDERDTQDHNLELNGNSVSTMQLPGINTGWEENVITQHLETHTLVIPDKNSLSLVVPTTSLVSKCSLSVKNSVSLSNNLEKCENSISFQDQLATNHDDESGQKDNFKNSGKEFSEKVLSNEHISQVSGSAELENLWDGVDDNDLSGLSICLDALVSRPVSSTQTGSDESKNPSKQTAPFSAEDWSMGHVVAPQGDFVKGSCVLVRTHTKASADECNQTSITSHQYQERELNAIEEDLVQLLRPSSPSPISQANQVTSDMRRGGQKKSPSLSPRISPRSAVSDGISPGIDSSIQSVSSQMGRRELAAFTKFAREIRPQIILENPGIAFTQVAALLAEKWQSLSTEERDRYEEIARETATTRKVWKTLDKQKKLPWVKKLPASNEKRRIPPSNLSDHKKLARHEVPCTIGIDTVKEKNNIASLSVKRQHLYSSSLCLLGHLEPSGTWVCIEKGLLSLLNPHRLQEVVINHRLLETHALARKPLLSLEKIDPLILGEEAWTTLISLPFTLDNLRHTRVVTADVISKNGFKIEICLDNKTAILTEVAEALNYYGIKELKETLELCRAFPVVEMSRCRPLRVVNHIKSEAMRICRKSPSMLQETMVGELIEYWKTVMKSEDVNCLHSKPILSPVFNLNDRTVLVS